MLHELSAWEQVELLAGVTTDRYYEDDSGNVRDAVMALAE